MQDAWISRGIISQTDISKTAWVQQSGEESKERPFSAKCVALGARDTNDSNCRFQAQIN